MGFVACCSDTSSWPEERVRSVSSVIDEASVLPGLYWELLSWVGKAFLCGTGQAMKAMVPVEVLRGDPMSPCLSDARPFGKMETETCYRWEDEARTDSYLSRLREASLPVLIAFPEHDRAKSFFEVAKKEGLTGGLLWPRGGGSAKIRAWAAVRDGGIRYVVGGPGVISAPMVPGMIIIEDEGNDGYRFVRHPRLNARSVLSRMALASGSRLVLGGRIPSSRVFKEISPGEEQRRIGKRLVLVDIGEAHRISVAGASREILLTEGTMKRTIEVVAEGRTAIWILDRKGYVGELRCDDCGSSLTCACGGTYRLMGDRMVCVRCGRVSVLPDFCPECGGPVISGNNPGLEAFLPVAGSMFPEKPVFIWSAEEPSGMARKKERIKALINGGLVLGTRKALELCDCLDVGLICWIDGDGEARRPDHGARYNAYSMVAESCWRGPFPTKREVVLQSRVPGKGWQGALSIGWTRFWEKELAERSDLGLPPFRYLAEISDMGHNREKIYESLFETGAEVMDPDPAGDLLWVGFDRLSMIYKAMESFYAIGATSYPRVVLWTD